jgi:Lrp/AsnC family leucine-responsive transcriptional regulator
METLDKFDIAILSELQADARLTNAELAQRVGLSAAPCWRRVRALEESGFIKGYRAEIDRHKIGLGVLAFVRLDANRNTGELTREMEEAIRKIPKSSRATTSAAQVPLSCRWSAATWTAFRSLRGRC